MRTSHVINIFLISVHARTILTGNNESEFTGNEHYQRKLLVASFIFFSTNI